jgi:hypothetical protein
MHSNPWGWIKVSDQLQAQAKLPPGKESLGKAPSMHSNRRNYRMSEKSGTNGNLVYMLTPTLDAFSQLLYHVCADFAQHIGIDSSTTFCNSRILTAYKCAFRNPQNAKSNVNAIFSLLTFNFNLKIKKIIEIPIGSRLFDTL